MADRYWVGGSGTWDSSSTTNWSTTSGGAPGASAPTAADNVIFDAASHTVNYTVSISGLIECLNFSVLARTVRFDGISAGQGPLKIYGSLSVSPGAGVIWGSASATKVLVVFASTSTGNVVNSASTFNGGVEFNGVGGEWTFQQAVSAGFGVAFTLTAGTVITNNNNINCNDFVSTGSNTRTFNLGTGIVIFDNVSLASTGFTFVGTGSFRTDNDPVAKSFATGGVQNLPLLEQNGTGALTISGGGKFADIKKTTASASTILFTPEVFTFDAFTLSGAAGAFCTIGRSGSSGVPVLRKSAPWFVGANSVDGGGNTGLIFAGGGGIDYLSISNIYGIDTSAPASGANFIQFFIP